MEYTRGEERKVTQERKAEQYAHAVIGSLNAGAAGFIDWNLLLNEKGGPNHARNFCEAPLMYDRDRRELVANRSFFYMAHFSRFVPVGSRRFLTSRYTDDLETVGLPGVPMGRVRWLCSTGMPGRESSWCRKGRSRRSARRRDTASPRWFGTRTRCARGSLSRTRRSCCGLRRIWFGIRYLRRCLRRFCCGLR